MSKFEAGQMPDEPSDTIVKVLKLPIGVKVV